MRKLFKMGIVTCLLCCLLASTVYAGNSSFGSTKVKYQTLSTGTELTSTSSRNTKATTNAKWFYYVTAISSAEYRWNFRYDACDRVIFSC